MASDQYDSLIADLGARVERVVTQKNYLKQVVDAKITERNKKAEELKAKGVNVDDVEGTIEKLETKLSELCDSLGEALLKVEADLTDKFNKLT